MATKAVLKRETTTALDALGQMWAQVDAIRALGRVLNERPPGSFTQHEFASRYHCTRTVARHQLDRLIEKGHLQRHKVRLVDSIGRVSVQNVYSPVTK